MTDAEELDEAYETGVQDGIDIERRTSSALPACSIAWRDLEVGEYIQPGDRMMGRDMKWSIITDDDVSIPIQIGPHTFPAQRALKQ